MFKKLFSENLAVYEIMWKNIVQPGRPKMTIWRMRIACWIPKATNTHSEYVILITFPPSQWLQERASMLHYTYSACLVQPSVYCAVGTRYLCIQFGYMLVFEVLAYLLTYLLHGAESFFRS
jgi:hypothetical protein